MIPIAISLIPNCLIAQGIEIKSGGGIVVTGAATIEISDGGIINDGTYTKGTETVTLSGTTDKSISGGTALSVNRMTVSSTGIISMENSVTADTLTINPSAKVTNNSGKTLGGTLLTIKSDVNGTGTFINNGTSSFTYTNVEQYFTGSGGATPNGRGYYLSSPVASALSSVFTASGGNGLWYHTESASGQGYTEVTNDVTSLTPMRGYLARLGASGAYTFTGGALNSNASYSTTDMSRTTAAGTRRGYHLIGNPYPSFLNWNTAIDDLTKDASTTNISPTIYYRTVNGSNVHVFDTYNATNHTGTNANGSGVVTRYIAPMQAVWVRVDGADGSTGTLIFNKTMCEHVSGAKLRNSDITDVQSIRLRVSNGSNEDEAILLFSAKAMDELDAWDSPKMFNNNTAIPEIYTYAGSEKVVINGMTENALSREQILGFKTGKAGTFNIRLSQNNLANDSYVVLKDKLLNTEQNLMEKPVYEFYSEVVTSDNRFVLSMNKTATPISMETETNSIDAYQQNNAGLTVVVSGPIKPKTMISLYNAMGQRLVSMPVTGEQTFLNGISMPGVYLLKVESGSWKSVKKIVIQKV